MSKRIIDTGIWDKAWFRNMPGIQKLGWLYVLTKCDYVGVWDADTEMADFLIGGKVDWEALKKECNNNIEVMDTGKWWVVDYCIFNYGNINELSKSSLQRAVHSRLVRRGLWDKYLERINCRVPVPYPNPTRRVNSNSNSNSNRKRSVEQDGPFATFWATYPRKVNKAGALKAWTARLRDGTMDAAEVMTALDNYVQRVAGKELEYVMHPATFLGPALRWKDYLVHGPKYVPAAKADDDLAWTCGGCGAEYRSTAHVCGKCGWERE